MKKAAGGGGPLRDSALCLAYARCAADETFIYGVGDRHAALVGYDR
jgi:hypothetical protein